MMLSYSHRFFLLYTLAILFFLGANTSWAAGPTVITGDIVEPTTWTKDNGPYILKNTITVNASLIIGSGTVVKSNNNATTLIVKNDFTAVGAADDKIVFTSVCDDNYGGDTKGYSARCNSGPIHSQWGGISLDNTAAHVMIEHSIILYAGRGISYQTNIESIPYREVSVTYAEIRQCASAMYLHNTMPNLQFNVFEENEYGLEVTTNFSDRKPIIRDSSFINNGIAIKVNYPGTVDVDARFNWWGDKTGPYFQSSDLALDNSGGLGDHLIQSRIQFRPWLESEPVSPSECLNCASNVLFLPGIKASKLYKNDALSTEDQLWLPNYFGNDLEDLALDENGNSINNVYTKDVLTTIPFGNIYASFVSKLDTLKGTGVINNYQAFAYDWRQNVEDIINRGTPYPEGVIKKLSLEAEILARDSKTRKITIVAHSNGGLLAKALMEELEKRGLIMNVDTVVFVGVPQMGTPLSILSLLYGYDESIPTLVSRKDARTLAENMPGAYSLLPSEEYFNRIVDPLITFSSEHTRYKKFMDAYGSSIEDYWGLYGFLHADDDGRDKPSASEIELENVLSGNLLDQARYTHSHLDNWVPPSGVHVVQVAGWGLDTISGIDYSEEEKITCQSYSSGEMPSCIETGEYTPIYDPKFTVDGDNVVVAPSALMLPETENVKSYWMDLHEYNKGIGVNRKHGDLLEVDSLETFLSNIIEKNTSAPLPRFLKTSRPDDYAGAKPRLRMALYSPLNIHLFDGQGRHTGPKKVIIDNQEITTIEENIPNSYYYQFGDRKYVGFSEGDNIHVEMDGYALGTYTLKLEEVLVTKSGEEKGSHMTFEHLPTTEDTRVQFDIPDSGLADLSDFRADINSDDVNDYTVIPVLNGTVSYVLDQNDTTPPVTAATFSGTSGLNNWYTSDVTVTLTATDNTGGSGVDITEYSLDGTTWNTYTSPFAISREGATTLQYQSTDKQGNKEATKTETIKIDKTAPEAKISLNPITEKLDISGTDNLSGVSVVTVDRPEMSASNKKMKNIKPWFAHWLDRHKKNLPDMLATLTDGAGHTTSLSFEKTKDRSGFVFVRLLAIDYDGSETILKNTDAQYKWRRDWKSKYQLFATSLRTETSRGETHYNPKKNETWIMEKSQDLRDDDRDDESDKRLVMKKIPGMIVPYLMSTQGKMQVGY